MSTTPKTATAEGSIAPRTIIGGLPLVENARLIEVTTINKKVAEQLPQRNIGNTEMLEGFEILGLLGSYKVVVRENGKLWWIHQVDYADWRGRTGATAAEGYAETYQMPQLFAA
jgi:hypothetical protein